jgi:2-methylcitrate dehydratase PrpD
LHAALMAEAGFRGVRDCLDHPSGWMMSAIFSAAGDSRAYLTEKLGERWELPLTAYKRFPVGGPTQPAVEGLLKLLPQIERDKVERVHIAMPGRWQAFRDAEMPALNLRYLSAIILIDGKLDFVSAQSLERMHGDARAKALMERVTIEHDPAQEAKPGEPRTESARVTVSMAGGAQKDIYVPYVLGFPSHPMSRPDVESKALELMAPHLGEARTKDVIRRVAALEGESAPGALAGLIAR